MIIEQPDFDLSLLAEHFTECGDYTKEVILEELRYWQKHSDFLCIVSSNNGIVDGFLIGYRNRNSLWIAQVWCVAGIKTSREAIEMAKDWAREKSMTSLTCETDRKQIKALKRYGFLEEAVLMKVVL